MARMRLHVAIVSVRVHLIVSIAAHIRRRVHGVGLEGRAQDVLKVEV